MIDINKNRIRLFLSLFGLAFIIRIICIIIFADTLHPEMWEFGIIARNLLSGNGYSYTYNGINVVSAFMPPALAYIYYFFFYFFGDNSVSYFLILLFNSLIAGFSVIIIYRITEIIYDVKIALLSAIYGCLSPIFLFSTINFNSIIIYHLLVGLLFLMFLKIINENNSEKIKYGIYLGIVFGISFLVRADFILFMIIVAFILLVKKKKKIASFTFIISLIILLPWTYRNYQVFGEFIPVTTSFGTNFYYGHSHLKYDSLLIKYSEEASKDSSYELKVSDYAYHRGLYFIKDSPLDEISETTSKIFCLWFVDKYRESVTNLLYLIIWLPTLLFFILGYYRSMKLKNVKDKFKFMNMFLLFSTFLVIVFFNIPRYQVQMSFIMIPTSMYGLNYFISYFKILN